MALGRLLRVGVVLLGAVFVALAQEDNGGQDDDAYVDNDTDAEAGNCECVPFFLCDKNNMIITDGRGVIDVKSRLGDEKRVFNVSKNECPKDENQPLTCCTIPPPQDPPVTVEPKSTMRLCGVRGSSGGFDLNSDSTLRIQGGSDLSFGELPWMLILMKMNEGAEDPVFKCGASLIHPQVALTAAHCVCKDLDATHYIVRAGEFDTSVLMESLPLQDQLVSEIALPANYNPLSLFNDFALLRLEQPLMYDTHIAPICLAGKTDIFDGAACMASGWGRNLKDPDNTVMRKVDLKIVGSAECQKKLRSTRLGYYFLLDPSFICAQGKNNADTCDGDGGTPLICPLRTDPKRWVQVGITAWGIGCTTEVPGVYANVAKGRHWIDPQLRSWGFHLEDEELLDATIKRVYVQPR